MTLVLLTPRVRARFVPALKACNRVSLVFPERTRDALTTHQRNDPFARQHTTALGPGFVLKAHRSDSFRFLLSQVVQFSAVFFHVVELPGIGIVSHELPVSKAHGSVS